MIPPKRRCWYCKRVGRFGWKRGRLPSQAAECKNDPACFERHGLISYDEFHAPFRGPAA